jgi:secreted trypsin-like serine protease
LNQTVRLDNGKNSFPGRNCTVLGWGATEEGAESSDLLKELTIPVVEQSECQKKFGARLSDAMICAGGAGGKDACQGGMILSNRI